MMHTTSVPNADGHEPVLELVTGYTCDICKSTNVKETGLQKSSDGEWIVTKCGDCDVTVMYKTK